MPRNTRGGNKAKRGKNAPRQNNKSLRTKDPNTLELYGKAVKRLGGSPPIILVLCEDGKERRCVIRGKFQKRIWINPDDYVLITCNNESGISGEVTCKYNSSEVARLEEKGEISPQTFNKNEDHDNNVVFTTEKETDDKVDEYYSLLEPDKDAKPSTFVALDEDSDEVDFDDI